MSATKSLRSTGTSAQAPRTYFIADLHLDPARHTEYQLALDFFNTLNGDDALYILGDLFEYWIGDDAGVALYADIIAALAALSEQGCNITLMLGNRDFLLGKAFAEAARVTLVRDDELTIVLDEQPLLLLHGDTLCIDDHAYQSFRQQVRDAQWQREFLSQPINERLAYAEHLREQSKKMSAGKTQALMDVNEETVQSRFRAHGCQRMIHGHTHRPDVHDDADGQCRMVVGDWHEHHACYVVKDADGFQLRRFGNASA